MKFVSWNVNGLRACMNKGFMETFQTLDADIFCLQETKMQPHQLELDLPRYKQYWNSAEKKGYSGTAIFTKVEPLNVSYGLGISKRELERLDYRMQWEDAFRNYLVELNKQKPVVMCGDLNVAHKEIDLKNPKTNRRSAGFTDEERSKMTELLQAGFVDTFRYLYPDKTSIYSWWSYMRKARENNAGWRIDYFIVSKDIEENIKEAGIHNEFFGSDHCPVSLELDI